MISVKPTKVVKPLAEINQLQFISDLPPGIRGITWDLDKTLVGQHELRVPRAHIELLHGLARLDLKQGIISNANSEQRTERVQWLAEIIRKEIGTPVFVVTSMMVGGTRKPKRPVFDQMAKEMGLPANSLCHVGDQLFKDVLGANLADYGASVLVPPYGEGDDRAVKYLQRPLEALARPIIGLPFHVEDFGK